MLAHPRQRPRSLETVKESKRRQLSLVINWIWRHEWLSFITTTYVVLCHLQRQYLTKSRVSFGRFSDMFLVERRKKKPLLFHVTSAVARPATREHCLLWPSLTCHQFAPHCSSSGEVSCGDWLNSLTPRKEVCGAEFIEGFFKQLHAQCNKYVVLTFQARVLAQFQKER